MKKKRLSTPKKNCFVCFYFTLGEFTEEDIKRCAEHWLDAENCPNWCPFNVYLNNKEIIWVDLK